MKKRKKRNRKSINRKLNFLSNEQLEHVLKLSMKQNRKLQFSIK